MVLEYRLSKFKEVNNIRSLQYTMQKINPNLIKYLNIKTMSMFLEESLIIPNNHEDEEKRGFS